MIVQIDTTPQTLAQCQQTSKIYTVQYRVGHLVLLEWTKLELFYIRRPGFKFQFGSASSLECLHQVLQFVLAHLLWKVPRNGYLVGKRACTRSCFRLAAALALVSPAFEAPAGVAVGCMTLFNQLLFPASLSHNIRSKYRREKSELQ